MYLGSLLHYDLSDHHDVEARLKKASQAFGALRSKIFSSRDILRLPVYRGPCTTLSPLLFSFFFDFFKKEFSSFFCAEGGSAPAGCGGRWAFFFFGFSR